MDASEIGRGSELGLTGLWLCQVTGFSIRGTS